MTAPSLPRKTRATTLSPDEIQRFDPVTKQWRDEADFFPDGSVTADHSWVETEIDVNDLDHYEGQDEPFFECIRCGFVEGVVEESEMPLCPGPRPEGRLAKARKFARDAQHMRARAWWNAHGRGHS